MRNRESTKFTLEPCLFCNGTAQIQNGGLSFKAAVRYVEAIEKAKEGGAK